MTRSAFLENRDGSTAIEFALIIPLLFCLLFATIEVGVQGMVSSAFDSAVASAGRSIRTGQADGPTSASAFKDLICAKMTDSLTDCRSRLDISVKKFSGFTGAGAASTATPDGSFDKGAAGDTILVLATYKWPAIAPTFSTSFKTIGPATVLMQSQAAFKNEPFT